MIAILAEKPSAMRNMAKAFNGTKGSINGEAFQLCCARGHLYEFVGPSLQVKKDLQPKYKSWLLENMPWDPNDFSWKYGSRGDADRILEDINDVFEACDEICIATDDDPSGEGTLLAGEIIIELGFDGRRKISRMFFADESPKELQKAFQNRKYFPSVRKDPDYIKALYRSKWDMLSMQFTRIATKCGDGESVLRQGRLKSAMLLLVGEQLAKVSAYKKIPFYQYRFQDENGNKFVDPEEPSVPDRNALEPGKYTASNVVPEDIKHKKQGPPKLIDLASLSARLASKGFKAQEVLSVYQKMYEAQVVSYPRTEDRAITKEQFNELLPLAGRIAGVIGVDPGLLTHRSPRPEFVKEGMAHGANRPGTNVPKNLADLDQYGKCAQDIYTILAASYLAMLCEDYEYDAQDAHLEKYPGFRSHVNIPTPGKLGWKAVYSEDADDEAEDAGKGFGKTAEPFVYEGFPPKPQKPTMKWLMAQLEKNNVGTGATRTSTYADVTSEKTKYPLMIDKRGAITMSQFGDMGYRLLPGTHIGTLEITTHVFNDMAAIAKGEKDPDECLAEIAGFVRDDMEIMKSNGEKMRQELGIQSKAGSAERFTGVWNGKEVSPKRSWSNHRFTDEECEALLRGEEITIDCVSAKSGKPFKCKGRLAELTYNGKKYVGFDKTEFVNDGPRTYEKKSEPDGWCRHTFTDKEKKDLLAGKTVSCKSFVKKDGKTKFGAKVKWNAESGKIDVVEWLKQNPGGR